MSFISELIVLGYKNQGDEYDEIRAIYATSEFDIIAVYYHGMGHYQVVGQKRNSEDYFLSIIGGSDGIARISHDEEFKEKKTYYPASVILDLAEKSIDNTPLTS